MLHYSKFDWNYAAFRLLSASARKEYNISIKHAKKNRNKIVLKALAEYEKKTHTNQEFEKYGKIRDSALLEYLKSEAAIWDNACRNDGV